MNKNVSPVGWYVVSYILRFVEGTRDDAHDLDARFLAWENTIIVKAKNLDEAYRKAVAIAEKATRPYKGGPQGVDAQWLFEGLTELLPMYEDLEDGAEIMWADRGHRKLKNIRKQVRQLIEFRQ